MGEVEARGSALSHVNAEKRGANVGHPAYITFAAGPASPSSINFYISLGGKIASPMEFRVGGSAFEDAQWNHFLAQVSAFCKAGS